MRIDERLRCGQTREVVDRRLQPLAVGVFGWVRKNASWASSASCRRLSGPAIQTGLTRALSSQNRMNTLVSTHATAAWVTRSSRQATQDAAVRSLSGRAGVPASSVPPARRRPRPWRADPFPGAGPAAGGPMVRAVVAVTMYLSWQKRGRERPGRDARWPIRPASCRPEPRGR